MHWKLTDVSEEHTASIFTVELAKQPHLWETQILNGTNKAWFPAEPSSSPTNLVLSCDLFYNSQIAVTSALRSRRPLFQEDSWYSFLLRGWVNPRAIVRMEWLGKLKNPIT
jgi:hypothetical protein